MNTDDYITKLKEKLKSENEKVLPKKWQPKQKKNSKNSKSLTDLHRELGKILTADIELTHQEGAVMSTPVSMVDILL